MLPLRVCVRCHKLYAVDIEPSMVAHLTARAKGEGLANMTAVSRSAKRRVLIGGQWRAMPGGIDGIHGIGGNVVSVSYRF